MQVCRCCASRKGGTGGSGWGAHVAAWLHGERYSYLVGGPFLARKAAWALSGCLITESADYCMLVDEWAWLRSQVYLLRVEVNLGSVLESESGQKWRYTLC